MATQNTEAVGSESTETTPTFEQQVNTITSKMTRDDKGNWQLPEGEHSEAVQYAANVERRRRDTESALGKTRSQLKAQETIATKLTQKVVGSSKLALTSDQKEELDDLKYSDPEAWHKKLVELETSASTTLNEEISTWNTEASQQAEIEARQSTLNEFNLTHSTQITDEVIINDVPPRITKKLESGKITFSQYLDEVHTYITKPKKVGGTPAKDTPNLGNSGGGSSPTDEASAKRGLPSYADTVF